MLVYGTRNEKAFPFVLRDCKLGSTFDRTWKLHLIFSVSKTSRKITVYSNYSKIRVELFRLLFVFAITCFFFIIICRFLVKIPVGDRRRQRPFENIKRSSLRDSTTTGSPVDNDFLLRKKSRRDLTTFTVCFRSYWIRIKDQIDP